MNSKQRKSSMGSLRNVVLGVLFMVGSGIWVSSAMRNTKQEVRGEVHWDFPVLVITPNAERNGHEASIVYHGEMKRFLEEHPEYTFLVPLMEQQSLSAQLAAESRGLKSVPEQNFESPDTWMASFKVEQLDEGRQLLEVFHTRSADWVNTGWYEATSSEIFPRYHAIYSEERLLAGIMMSVGTVWVLGFLVFWATRFLYVKLFG